MKISACSYVEQHPNTEIGILLHKAEMQLILAPKYRHFGVNQNKGILESKCRHFEIEMQAFCCQNASDFFAKMKEL
jgi:hypothetical protein